MDNKWIFNKGVYHVYNKTLDNNNIFKNDFYLDRFIQLIPYYISIESNLSFSKLKDLSNEDRNKYLRKVYLYKNQGVKILAYSIMPNHFHMLVKEEKDNFVSIFISKLLNSITKYYNIQNNRLGNVFLKSTKTKLIETEEQLKHTSSYIHLNEITSNIVLSKKELISSKRNSLKYYTKDKKLKRLNTKTILDIFDGSKIKYKNYVFNNIEYQKNRKVIKDTLNLPG